jgi:LysR family transcriptional regulator, low CO2-responsive transcriptional regulator
MNLIHILAFHRVATAGSYAAAARLGGISQPTLSAQVRALERSTGTALFDRVGRGIRLTAQGRQLLEATEKLSIAIDHVSASLVGDVMAHGGLLRISADSAVHVLPVLAAMKVATSRLEFAIRIDNSTEVTARVLAEEADIGVTARPSSDPRLFSEKLRDDRLVLLVGAADHLARRKSVRLDAIRGRDLVMREKGSMTREVAQKQMAGAGVKPRQVFDVETREAVREAVAAGFGVGLVFASEAGRDTRLRTIPIRDADVRVAEYAICLASRRSVGLVNRFFLTAHKLARAGGWLRHSEHP